MIRISKGPGGEGFHQTALVAFDRTSGKVYGTFVHASLQKEDAVEISRSRERFLADLQSHPERGRAQIEVLQLPLHELPSGSFDRVDPQIRKPLTNIPSHHLPGIAKI